MDDEGAESAFRQAAVSCLDGLYGFALALSRDRAAAEDLVQETYARAFAAHRRPAPGENLRGWLFTILSNLWKNERKRRRPEAVGGSETLDHAAPTGSPDPYAALDRRELREALREALGSLPESFREVVVLRCVEGFSYQEVAQVVGCPAGTVMSRLARARALLRPLLVRSRGPRGGTVATLRPKGERP